MKSWSKATTAARSIENCGQPHAAIPSIVSLHASTQHEVPSITMTTAEASQQTDGPPFPAERIANASFPERAKLSCQNWAYSSPNRPSVMAFYWVKYFFVLIALWAFWCSFNAGYAGFFSFSEWAFTGEAFKKAIVWSMCWELFGFGCGWGPMNARYEKWFGTV